MKTLYEISILLGVLYIGYIIGNTNKEIRTVQVPLSQVDCPTFEEVAAITVAAFLECSICPEDEVKQVAKVIMNRVDDPRWPNNAYDVVTQKGQFDAIKGYDLKRWVNISTWVNESLSEPRDTSLVGYFRKDTATDLHWVKKMEPKVKIKKKFHQFHAI